jgi:hypothetical protein
MSNLIKHTSVSIPKEVSNISRNVYLSHSSDIIKNIDNKNIVVNSIHQAVNKCLADKGINMLVEDMNYLKLTITDDIFKDFPTLTLQDISLCFSMGVRGNLGEYFGVNVVTLYGWLKKYKEEVIPEANKEVNLYIQPAQLEEPKIDFKKLDLEKVDNICSAIELYINDSIYDFNDFGNIHYKFLDNLGYFNSFSETEKDSLKEDAKQLFISDIKNNNLNLIERGKTFQITDINKLMENIENGEKDTETIIEISYKKLLLKRFIVNFKFSNNKLDKFKKDLITKIKEHYEKK